MSIMEMLDHITAGGVVSVIVILLTLIEVTPIKISPLQWIGKRVNKDVNARMDKMEEGMKQFGNDLDEHIAQGYRNKILLFQNQLLHGLKFTKEQYDEVIEACEKYEEHCESHDVSNGKCVQAIDYIRRTYQKRCDAKDFIDVITTEIVGEYAEDYIGVRTKTRKRFKRPAKIKKKH